MHRARLSNIRAICALPAIAFFSCAGLPPTISVPSGASPDITTASGDSAGNVLPEENLPSADFTFTQDLLGEIMADGESLGESAVRDVIVGVFPMIRSGMIAVSISDSLPAEAPGGAACVFNPVSRSVRLEISRGFSYPAGPDRKLLKAMVVHELTHALALLRNPSIANRRRGGLDELFFELDASIVEAEYLEWSGVVAGPNPGVFESALVESWKRDGLRSFAEVYLLADLRLAWELRLWARGTIDGSSEPARFEEWMENTVEDLGTRLELSKGDDYSLAVRMISFLAWTPEVRRLVHSNGVGKTVEVSAEVSDVIPPYSMDILAFQAFVSGHADWIMARRRELMENGWRGL